MDYYPTTESLEDTQQLDVKPNTPAPIVAYQSSSDKWQWQWVTPRNIALMFGLLVALPIGFMAARSTAIAEKPIQIAPLAVPTISKDKVDDIILNGTTDNLNELTLATDFKIKNDQLALKNERAKEITAWANKLVTDKNSDCYKSVYQRKCYLTLFINEQSERYRDAYRSRKWEEAYKASFQVESARIAWANTVDLPLDGDATANAMQNELKQRVSLERQSTNAQAAKDADTLRSKAQ
jgi:hypothetical protein